MTDTKEKILETALRLFARYGYDAVSVSTIAGELGITKGALYRHYADKHDIFDSIIKRMDQRDAEQAQAFSLPEQPLDAEPEAYRRATLDALFAFSRAQFRYWTEDHFAADFRRLLTVEQFKTPEMSALYQQYLASGPLGYVADILSSLGFTQPEQSAAKIYAPMLLFYSVYDAADDKARAVNALDLALDSVKTELEQHNCDIRDAD